MRRRPRVLHAFCALAVLWLAANACAGGARIGVGSAFGSVGADDSALSSAHGAVGLVATSTKGAPSDWTGRLFLPSPGVALDHGRAVAPSSFELLGVGERAPLTVTYDATAPPGASPSSAR